MPCGCCARAIPWLKVVKVLGVHERSVRRWIAWYRAGGVGTNGRRPQEQLKAKAAEEAFRTIYDAVRWVRETFGFGMENIKGESIAQALGPWQAKG